MADENKELNINELNDVNGGLRAQAFNKGLALADDARIQSAAAGGMGLASAARNSISFNTLEEANDYAKKVAVAMTSNTDPDDFGILLCGSGQGMAMQANRFKGIRAAICSSAMEAMEARMHNNANILCLSADENSHNYIEIINAFMDTKPLPDEKYQRRCAKLDEI